MEHEVFLPPRNRLSSAPVQRSRLARSQFNRFFLCIFMLKFLTQVVFGLLELPLVRLVEEVVCQNIFNESYRDLDEAQCKSKAVQDAIAQIVGFKTTFNALPCGSVNSSYGVSLMSSSRYTNCVAVWAGLRHLG